MHLHYLLSWRAVFHRRRANEKQVVKRKPTKHTTSKRPCKEDVRRKYPEITCSAT